MRQYGNHKADVGTEAARNNCYGLHYSLRVLSAKEDVQAVFPPLHASIAKEMIYGKNTG